MEPPDASIHRGFEATVIRSADAMRSGSLVAIADVPLLVRAGDSRRARVMAELLAALPAIDGRAVECSLTFAAGPWAAPDRDPDDTVFDGRVWQRDTAFAFAHSSGVFAGADAHHIAITGDAPDLRWPFRRLLHPALTHVLAHRARFVLHAAAVARDGTALLVLGGTGSGKSTSALGALVAGLDVLGDDLVVLAQEGPTVQVHGVPRPLAVPRDVVGPDVHVIDDHGLYGDDPRGRVVVPPGALSSGPARVCGVVLSDHAQTGSARLEPVDNGATLGEVLTAFTATRNAVLRSAIFPCATAVRRLPCWRLFHAADPRVRAEQAGALLTGALRSG